MAIDLNFLLVLKSSGLGDGEPDLGEKLLKTFLAILFESGHFPARIICLNSGIFLTTGASEASETLEKFQSQGTQILSCSTCLEYYGRKDLLAIGDSTTMKDTVSAMLSFERVIQP